MKYTFSFSIEDEDIQWGNGKDTPDTSRCSEPCQIGQIKQVA